MARKPIRIFGNWKEGFAFDLHTISSVYLGDNEYGHPVFDTKRSEMSIPVKECTLSGILVHSFRRNSAGFPEGVQLILDQFLVSGASDVWSLRFEAFMP